MSVAKCHNFTGCLLAYRGEVITLTAGAPLVCPECGKPVTIVKPSASKIWTLLVWLLLLGAAGGGIWYARPWLTPMIGRYVNLGGPAVASPTPKASAPTPGTAPVKATPAIARSTPVPATPAAEPEEPVTRPEHIDLNLAKTENQRIRDEVLRRIDVMPNVSQGGKDKLYRSVREARSMGLVLTIPFGSGRVSLSQAEIQQMRTELDQPEVAKLRDDPTAVFVILGYADPTGDERKNLDISQKRADLVLDTMRDKCGVANVMHAVAMGGQKLLDTNNLEKNRVTEVWVALP